MRENRSGFFENGFFAKTTTSDLIPKESAGTGPCQNNSETSRDHPPELAVGPQAEPHSRIPNRLRLRGQAPSTLSHSPMLLCKGELGILKQSSLSLLLPPPVETTRTHRRTHARRHGHTHPNFQKALGTAHPFLSWTELWSRKQAKAAFFIPSPPPSLLQSQGIFKSFRGNDWWGGGCRHRSCCQVLFFLSQYVL